MTVASWQEEMRKLYYTTRTTLKQEAHSTQVDVHVSPECRDLISRIFVPNPTDRITMSEIKSHPWFVRNLPSDLEGDGTVSYEEPAQPMQNMDDIMQILAEATIPADGARRTTQFLCDDLDDDDMDLLEDVDMESSGEIV